MGRRPRRRDGSRVCRRGRRPRPRVFRPVSAGYPRHERPDPGEGRGHAGDRPASGRPRELRRALSRERVGRARGARRRRPRRRRADRRLRGRRGIRGPVRNRPRPGAPRHRCRRHRPVSRRRARGAGRRSDHRRRLQRRATRARRALRCAHHGQPCDRIAVRRLERHRRGARRADPTGDLRVRRCRRPPATDGRGVPERVPHLCRRRLVHGRHSRRHAGDAEARDDPVRRRAGRRRLVRHARRDHRRAARPTTEHRDGRRSRGCPRSDRSRAPARRDPRGSSSIRTNERDGEQSCRIP